MISKKLKAFVFERAGFICEYCLAILAYSPQPFEGEHIIPVSKNGSDDEDNLACACGGCNGSKYNKTHAPDPFDGKLVELFHPRQMSWNDHFIWSRDFLYIIGITAIGRATVETLELNRIGLINFRRALLKLGVHPPK
jgi:HNH endonuclease